MASGAISVKGLWKEYSLGERHRPARSLYEALGAALSAPWSRLRRLGGHASEDSRFWALSDVDFEIAPGEVVGIIGRNGAGKSTLLKVLSRITAPTRGRVEIRGRLASLLEVGTGFHPELNGRENIYLNGAILGMRRQEVQRKFDEIVAFAEVERFVDTPVKHYSSGMYVRLAFAVAAHLEPEILVVDEVLAVGDARFQKRCLGKMKDVAGQGRTVLFVSHNMLAVQRLCQRAIWLADGAVHQDGPAADVVHNYLEQGLSDLRHRSWSESDAPGNDQVRVLLMSADPLHGGGAMDVHGGVRLAFEFLNLVEGAALTLSLHIFNSEDLLVLNAVPVHEPVWFGKPMPAGRFRCECELPGHFLNADHYRVELLVVREQADVIWREENALSFELREVATDVAWHGRWPGVVHPRTKWTTTCLDGAEAQLTGAEMPQ
jgi:lipopolysaccharide transport system ATP-binding protein